MTTRVILDTGPLVAVLSRQDKYHGWACAEFARLRPPLLTCEAVLTEAAHLLRHSAAGTQAILSLVERRTLDVALELSTEAAAIAALMKRYGDVPMSLADACVVRLAELTPGAQVFTLDGDFAIYRLHGRKPVPLLAPAG